MSMVTPSDSCGCCAGVGVETPLALYNRPGLAAIVYRVGTYSSVRQSLLARLSDYRFSVLGQLRTRDSDDFTIALLDAWAMVSDVLTFYQERIANEAYLRTATERLSILEQSRLLGYQLAPGLAASTYLAFTIETATAAPEQPPKPVQVAIGTRVQSVPGPDEQPQSFETIEAIEARAEWNVILPQLTAPQTLAWDMEELWLERANLNLAAGDVLLIISDATGTKQASIRRITKVSPDAVANRTSVTLVTISIPLLSEISDSVAASPPGVYVMRVAASPFGHNAPKEAVYINGMFDHFQEWTLDADENENQLTLSARYDKIVPDTWVVIAQLDLKDSSAGVSSLDKLKPSDLTWKWIFSKLTFVTQLSIARYGMAGNGTLLFLERGWKRINDFLVLLRTMSVAAQSEVLAVAAVPVTFPFYGSTMALNTRVEGVLPGRPIAVSGKRQQLRITELALNPVLFLEGGERVDLQPGDLLSFAGAPLKVVGLRLVAMSPEEFGASLREDSQLLFSLRLIDRDGRTGVALLLSSAFALEGAAETDATIREIAFINYEAATAVIQDRDRTTLQLASPLANIYDRATVRINANVAAATHGESVRELLGSGDTTIPYQTFTLRQPPLTYVSAGTASGSASTLKVYVNDVLWQEAPFLYGHGPDEHIYVTDCDDEGITTIRFGDGLTGARLPTGQNNVRAEYRKGVGLVGLVEAGQLSQLLTRPLGLREVINPVAAQGAEDAESRDDARRNAPTTVLTLDRAVSLQDYEDFARTFAGIAKAQAVWVWDGRRRNIFLTVAGLDGGTLPAGGTVIAKLKGALRNYGDPFVAFTIVTYRKALFQIHGTVTIDAEHLIDAVMAAVSADLQLRYSFDTRDFGQPVALSEVIAAIQSVPGVLAVTIDKFFRNDAPDTPIQPRLIANRPAMGADGNIAAAELLILDATSLSQLNGIQ